MLDEIISYSKSFDDFLRHCTDSGIEYVYKPQNKVKLKFRLKDEGQQRFTRADTLGEKYEPEAIAETISTAQKKAAAAEQVQKFFAARRARRQAELAMLNESSAKSAEPKATPAIQTPQSQPTEVKAPEKKEDVWASIRGMGKTDEIIADLEAVGIKSYSEFAGFMYNAHHDDDHTDELAELKKKYTAIDKLLAMMKQRSQHAATYKEYQERSAFTQKGFRKKNAAVIDSYKEADKYIREHIRDYYVDGKAPKRSELEAMSQELKEKRKALMPEHKVFLAKRETTQKYTRQVRQYINEQHNKREREKYQQKKLSQHKKKDTLE